VDVVLLSTAKTLLKRYGFDNTDPVLEWLNAGLYEFCIAFDWPFMARASTTVVPGLTAGLQSITYLNLTPDQYAVQMVRDTTNDVKLQYVEPTQFFRDYSGGTTPSTGGPTKYTITRGGQEPTVAGSGETMKITLWPTSTVDLNIEVTTAIFPSPMTDEATHLPVPEACCYAVVTASAFIALQAENEEERAQTAQAQFQSRVASLINRYNPDTQDEPGQVSDVQGYFSS
jgi:hypothetical protein